MWCIRDIDAGFIARMEDILDLYAEPQDLRRPVVCFDEGLKQLSHFIAVARTELLRVKQQRRSK